MALLNLTSAIILILLGMRYLRKGLDRLFGNQLVEWLQETAKNRYKAFFAGAGSRTRFVLTSTARSQNRLKKSVESN